MELTWWPIINFPGAIDITPTPNFASPSGGRKFWKRQLCNWTGLSTRTGFRLLKEILNLACKKDENISKITRKVGTKLTVRPGWRISGRYHTRIFPCLSTIVVGLSILPILAILKKFSSFFRSLTQPSPPDSNINGLRKPINIPVYGH